MAIFNIHEAKTHLSRLVEQVSAGETIILARAGKPVAKVSPVDAPPAPRRQEHAALRCRLDVAGKLDGELRLVGGVRGGWLWLLHVPFIWTRMMRARKRPFCHTWR